MITFKFAVGNGDREAPKVTDDLILTEEMAKARAIQALCEYYKVPYSRTVRSTIDVNLELGETRSIAVIDPQFDSGMVTGITTTLSPNGCYEDVVLEKYVDMGV